MIPNNQTPVFSHAEPVLAVTDIAETVAFWHETLGFPQKWTWGDPPNHGGVSWHGAFVQFSLNPDLAAVSKGNCIWIRVAHIESLYAFHQQKKLEIVEPLENKPWGMAGYIVREINGYYVIFAAPITDRVEKKTSARPVQIIERKPTAKEFISLTNAVGWSKTSDEQRAEMILAPAVFGVVAQDGISGNIVGAALLLGDGISFYYVKDVMVHPDWQGTGVGTALMEALTRWLDLHAPTDAYIGLFASEHLEPFYQQFGFRKVFGMHRGMGG